MLETMTNIEYIYLFADKHNFPKTECEIVFNVADDGVTPEIYACDYDIVSVKFDKNLVENEIKIEDIRFDIDSNFPDDVFFMWQKDDPDISFKQWITLGRYIPTIIENSDFLNELDNLTKEIEMKLESMFANIETNDNSDFDDGDEEYKDGED
jgi:hypothetical protein